MRRPRTRRRMRLGPAALRPDLRRSRRAWSRRCAASARTGATSRSMCAIRMWRWRLPRRRCSSTRRTPSAWSSRATARARSPAASPSAGCLAGDADAVNRIYRRAAWCRCRRNSSGRSATAGRSPISSPRTKTGNIIGTVMGVDHGRAFGDPERGSLALVPRGRPAGRAAAHRRGAGAISRRAFQGARGGVHRPLRDARQRISPSRSMKSSASSGCRSSRSSARTRSTRSSSPAPARGGLNPYARLIVDEARRRGHRRRGDDAEGGFFRLSPAAARPLPREPLAS
jgi:hypothetical protein